MATNQCRLEGGAGRSIRRVDSEKVVRCYVQIVVPIRGGKHAHLDNRTTQSLIILLSDVSLMCAVVRYLFEQQHCSDLQLLLSVLQQASVNRALHLTCSVHSYRT